MPSDRTTVTELGTGLGMLGLADIDGALRSRTPVMHSLSPECGNAWQRLRAGGAYDTEFHAALANGQAFLPAADGLRGRLPTVVEWKGTGRAPGDEVAPIDLRVDHVYLVSCKYLSNILFNVSPSHVFDSLLVGGQARGGRARAGRPPRRRGLVRRGGPGGVPGALRLRPRTLGSTVDAASPRRGRGRGAAPGAVGARPPRPRRALPGLRRRRRGRAAAPATGRAGGERGGGAAPSCCATCRARAVDLTSAQRDALGRWLRPGWPAGAKDRYAALSGAVARASVRRWEAALDGAAVRARPCCGASCASAALPYFVLGSSAGALAAAAHRHLVGLAAAVPLLSFTVEPQPGGQPRVGWEAVVRHRVSHEVLRGGGAHRGALEPRPFRRPPRGEGLPRHAASSRPGVFPPPMSEFDPEAFAPPLRVPTPRLAPPVVLRPYAVSDLAMVRQASADPLIPPSRRSPAPTRTTRGGPSSSASTPGRPRATASPS